MWCVFYAIFWVMFRFQLFCRIIFQRSWTTVLLPIWKPRYLLWLCPGPIWSLYCFCILNEDDNVIKSNGIHRHCLDWVQPLGMNMNIKISICMGMVTVRVLCFLNARICTDTLAPYKNLSIVILNFKAQKLYRYCNLTRSLTIFNWFFCLWFDLVGCCYFPIIILYFLIYLSFLIQLDNVSGGLTEWKGLLRDYWTRFKSYCERTSNVHIHQVWLLSLLKAWNLDI